ncbi:vascular endothelial growth factor receptor 2-like, partial [Paramuricea clavata]
GKPRPKPDISIQTSVAYGKDVTLKCSAIGTVKLTWYKSKRNGTRNDWQLMNAGEADHTFHRRTGLRETKRFLVIKKFNVSDNGVYICDLYRYYVNWRAHKEKYVGIKGFQKPNFTAFPKPLITVQPVSRFSIHLDYRVEGIPSPSITWYKINGDKIKVLSNCDKSKCINNDPNDHYLDITRTVFGKYYLSYPSDNATLKCVASNSLGSATKTFRLNMLAKPKIAKKNKENLSFVHVYKEGQELVCMVEEANPNQISFTWVAQLTGCTNADCKPNNSNWQVVTGTESGLEIITTNSKSTLILEKSEQHFFYRCTARNTVGEDNHIWKVVPVTESQPLKAVQSLVEVNEAENAELSCAVAKFISNQVYWSFNNVALQLGPRMKVDNSSSNGTVYNTLHITNVNVTDAGKYQCFGEFDGISEAAEIQLKVRELNAPSVSLKNLTRKQSSSFLVRCNVSGHPKPRITWKKDGEMLKVRGSVQGTDDCKSRLQGRYMLPNEDKNHATVLVICKADYKKDLGQFSCTAHNRLGNDTAKAFVDILAPPVIIAFVPQTKSIVLGQEFFLKCVANGNPKPHVWWEKKDKKTSMFKRVKNERSDELHFDALDDSNLGDYRCFAQNKENTSLGDFKLAPSPVTGKSMGTPAPISNKYPIVIGCVSFFIVAIVIIVAVVLYKRKKAYGGFYILTLPPLTDYIKKLDPHTPLTEQTNKLPYDAEWEFPRNRLKFSRELGCGAFGKVFLADAMGIVAFDPRGSTKRRPSRRRFGGSIRRNHYVNNNKMTKVAVKTLKEDSGETEYKDLLSELKILIHVGEHKNIVNLLGACTKGRESELWVIIEFCSNGNLLQFLRNRRDIYETEWKGVSKDPNFQLTMTDLVIAAYQVARGMEFLASRLCIHRDLATRNILVTENYVIKIADFGLARDVGEESQYVKTSN